MKKRFLTFILTIATMLMCIFVFSACGGNVEFKINFVVENEVYATVSTSGNEVIAMPENPTKDDYTFDGWYWDENTWEKPFTANSLLDAPLSSDMKVYAKFNKNHTHEYTPTTTEPTCTEKGLITYTCSCGDSYTEDIPATGEHTWDDGKITTEPTCTEKGVKTFTCTVCETTTYTEDVEALTHDEKTHQAQAPTCTEIGWNEYVTCKREGCEYSTYKEIPATGVHTWDKGEETKAPTCTKEGEMTYTCTVCKTATKTEPIDKLPHEHAEKWTSNATYHWHKCKCGDKKGEEKHTAGAPATATTPQTCTVCGYVLQVETGILFNTLTVNGTNVYGKVSNTTTEFSFIDEVTVKGNATYVVDNDKDCGSPIYSKTVDLAIGDNTFYVLEMIGNDVKLFTVTIRRRPMYEVTFNANGGTSVEKQAIEEDYLATEPETTRTGYTFTGWDYDFTQAITENTKITASWSANTDTKYTVNYYLQNLDDNNYTLKETVELKGETDTAATADIKKYTHFTFNQGYYKNALSGNINPDGGQVLSVYYTRDSYDIVVNASNVKAGTSTQINDTYKYDEELTLTATTNAGYTWLGWYDGENLACEAEEFTFKVEKDVTYTATWSANTDTKYTVIYYLQNLEDDNYTPYETVELKGETDTPTAEVDIREYTHFTYNKSKSVISSNIDGDGNRVLSVYYTRDSYKIATERNNTKAGTVTAGGTYKFDKPITLTATTNAGYTWLGWYDGETLVCETEEFTFKAEKDVTYTAIWSVNTDTKYTVVYYLQNLDDDNYTPYETIELKGETDTTATAEIKEYAHFTYNSSKSVISGNIDGDGKRALSIYYARNQYALSSNDSNMGSITNARAYKYGEKIATQATSYLGCEFLGWYGGEKLLSTDASYTFTATQNVTAKFVAKAEISIFNFVSTASTCIITGMMDKVETEIIIPNYVTGIGEAAFRDSHNLRRVVIGDCVTSIGKQAFFSCDNLRSVVIGDSVTSISDQAFYYCISLTSVVIGNSVTSIGSYAFYNCSSLTSIEIPDSVTSISYSAFDDCRNLTSVVIGNSVTSISEQAFYYCYKLIEVYNKSSLNISVGSSSYGYVGYYAKNIYTSSSGESKLSNDNGYIIYTDDEDKCLIGYNGTETDLTLPSYITQIYRYAFYNCESLTSAVIPISVTSIDNHAFSGCKGLTSVVIGDSVTSIGVSAFSGCTKLTSVEIPDSVTSIGHSAFNYCVSLTSVVIGNSTTSIGSSAFYDCKSLKCIEIPDSVTSIGGSAFYDCYNLTSVVIGNGVTSISGAMFYNCDSLTSVVIPNNVTSIGSSAFYNCESLTSVVIPGSVTSIGSSAFYNCESLTSVVIPSSVTSIGNYAFIYCGVESIIFRDTSTWYTTKSESDFSNKANGKQVNVSNASDNSAYFLIYFKDYYWYKL